VSWACARCFTTGRNQCHGLGLDRLHLVTLTTPDGQGTQRYTLTLRTGSSLAPYGRPEPPRFFDFIPTS